MNKLKVAVYAISKNEEKFVDRWMDSIQDADVICVTDTGSTDTTVEMLKNRGAAVQVKIIEPWRFDIARNISMDFIPLDVDVCICLDLDEVLEPGWRQRLEEIWIPGVTGVRYLYTWSFNDDGSRGVTFWKEKIHARYGYTWTHPVHEILAYVGDGENNYISDEHIKINHYPDPTKSRSSYLPLLELSVLEDPDDDRNMHYLGREYMYYSMWDKCIETLKRHLDLPTALWRDERSASMRFISRAYIAKEEFAEARSWLYRAIAEAPHLREGYVELAKLAYMGEDWPTVYHMAEEALKITERARTYINEVFSWDSTIYDLGSLACYYLGMYARAEELIKQAIYLNPNNDRLRTNLKLITTKLQGD